MRTTAQILLIDDEPNSREALTTLLASHGLQVSPAGNAQEAYELLEKGNSSLENALAVGANAEEYDISDLMNYISQTENEQLVFLYTNLLIASRNHLRAFYRQIQTMGFTYDPIVLDIDLFTEIITSQNENGKKYRLQKGNMNTGGKRYHGGRD